MNLNLPSPSQHNDAMSRRDSLRLLGLMGLASAFVPNFARAESPAPAAKPQPVSLAGSQPGHYRFHIGEIEALALNDGGFAAKPSECPWTREGQTARLPGILSDAFLPVEQLRLSFGVLLLRIAGELVLVDTGCGALFGPVGGRLVGNLAAAGISPLQISSVIISHLHGDHFGGLLDEKGQPVYPNARLFIHERELAFWSAESPAGVDPKSVPTVHKYLKAFEGKWRQVTGGDKLLEGLEVVDAFGHTPGHLALSISSGKEQLLHLVDVVHHHAISFAHPEFVNSFDVQSDIAIETRGKVLDRAASDRVRIFGAHMPFPSLGHVRHGGGGSFEYLIEPWGTA